MLITAIQVKRLENTGNKMQGIAMINLDNMIVIHDIKILKNNDVLFLAMPSRMTKMGTFKDIVHPITREVRETLERLIFAAYEECAKRRCTALELKLRTDCAAGGLLELQIGDYEVSNAFSYAT